MIRLSFQAEQGCIHPNAVSVSISWYGAGMIWNQYGRNQIASCSMTHIIRLYISTRVIRVIEVIIYHSIFFKNIGTITVLIFFIL